MIYIIFIVILFIFSLVEIIEFGNNILYKKDDKIFFILFSFFMISLSALRYKTGGDWYHYIPYFDNIKKTYNPLFDMEYGYFLLNVIFKHTFNNYFIMQFFLELFCGICVYHHIYKYSTHPVFSLFLYFFWMYFSLDMALNRQYLAVAIVLCGYKYIQKKKFFSYLLIIIIAMQFHSSAFACIVIYFFNKQLPTYLVCLVFLFSVCIGFWGHEITLSALKLVYPFMPLRFSSMIDLYLKSSIHTGVIEANTGLGVIMILLIAGIIVFLNSRKKMNPMFFNSFLVLFLVNRSGVGILGRFNCYFYLIGGGLFSYNILLDNDFFKKIFSIKYIYFVLVLSYFVFTFYKGTLFVRHYNWPPMWDLFVPYHIVFSSVDEPGRETLGLLLTRGVFNR
ncbi:putative membrane protein [Treponema primitia ZAS-2]|uniref:Putative membrane protein n=1 Tax=Treponema primitia (strain ATCC BAA-887 / DSM 12427 / ZAS-2) TaxID=545694 RepID=F5YMC4_TREPZ|nr:EpsG family protein [Treponema primitia]AEF85512.1 putative membrane protein [Treponema primitia ZAS-2]